MKLDLWYERHVMNKLLHSFYKVIFKASEAYESRCIIDKYQSIKKNSFLTREQIEEMQIVRLKEILKYAYDNIIFYKETFDRIGFNVDEVKSLEDLRKLPIIDKQIIINNESKFHNKNLNLIERKTGGSTGNKLKVYYDRSSLDMTAAINIRCLEWAGKFLGDKELHFSTNLNNKLSTRELIITKVKQFVLRRKDIFVDFSSNNNYRSIINELNKYNPKLVQGFPSFLYSLALYVKNNNICSNGFDVFESTGEQLYSFQRELIEEVFNCKVFNRYGDAEFGIIAYECSKHDGLHVCQDNVIVENLINTKGENELVVTTLSNKGMPLIRYRTGDLGTVVTDKCECGNNFIKIDNICGRIHDFIVISDDKCVSTSFFLDLLDKYTFMDDFQVFKDNNTINLLLKLKRYTALDELARLQKEVHQILNLDDVKLNIILVDRYNYSSAGKFRYIVNNIDYSNRLIKINENNYGIIYDTQVNKYKMIFGDICCVEGFYLPEVNDSIVQIWANKTGKIMATNPIKEIELCNLLINNKITFYENGLEICSLSLEEGWVKYNIEFKPNVIYSFKVDKELSERQKGKDPRELAVAFRFPVK